MRRYVAAILAVVTVGAGIYLWTALGRSGPGVDGPVVHSGFSLMAGGDAALIEGVVLLDGDCLYIGDPELPEIRHPAVWPHGTRWQEEPAGVVLPDGDVAQLGTRVSGGGGFHSDRDRVESVTNVEGAELTFRCTEEPYREVAIFNLGSSVQTID
jgi:hypothetical protein